MNPKTVAAFLTMGISTFKNRPILATPRAAEALKDIGPINTKAGEFDIMEETIVLSVGEDGAIQNAVLIPEDALLVVMPDEVPANTGRWMFPIV